MKVLSFAIRRQDVMEMLDCQEKYFLVNFLLRDHIVGQRKIK